jgi:hypothetical protein
MSIFNDLQDVSKQIDELTMVSGECTAQELAQSVADCLKDIVWILRDINDRLPKDE